MAENSRRAKQGETIFAEGDQAVAMYVVVEGQVQITRKSPEGPVVLANLQPGDFFGEMAIIDHSERSASAVALTDANLMEVKASELEQLLYRRPDVGARIIQTLVKRLKHTTNQVIDEKEKFALAFRTDLD